MTKIFKIIKWTVVVLVTILVIGFVYEQVSRNYFDEKRPAENEFVEINGRKIHF